MKQVVDILLIEDNQDHVWLTKKALRAVHGPNVKIHVAGDGEEALDFIEKQPPHEQAPTPDLILLDIKLPNKDGFELLESFKGHADHRTIPVVMLTSSDAEQDIARSYRRGANSYVTKPIKADELFEKIKGIPAYWLKINTLPPRPATT